MAKYAQYTRKGAFGNSIPKKTKFLAPKKEKSPILVV